MVMGYNNQKLSQILLRGEKYINLFPRKGYFLPPVVLQSFVNLRLSQNCPPLFAVL
jgi:hypothetical protein